MGKVLIMSVLIMSGHSTAEYFWIFIRAAKLKIPIYTQIFNVFSYLFIKVKKV